jgi:hypothetical protein
MSKGYYDCYGYFAIDRPHNTYPIKNVERHLESILSLKKGDVLNLKGIGDLQVINLNIDEYNYRDKGKDCLYQEIGIVCITI